MKKNHFLMLVVLAAIAAIPVRSLAQATESTSAAANIISPITIVEDNSLHFGSMSVLTGTGGTCVLSPVTGNRTPTGGVNLSTSGTPHSCAEYSVSGLADTNYAITLPGSITVTADTKNLTISAIEAKVGSGGLGTTGTLDALGGDTFKVGGTLNVPAGQAAGLYQGTFSVTVAYN